MSFLLSLGGTLTNYTFFSDNVARCLSLVFNIIFTYLLLGKSTSPLTCSTLLVVIIGFIAGIHGEIDFSLIGTAAGVLSSVFVSLNSIFTSKMLPAVDNDKSLLLYYNNLNASILFLPLIVLFEWQVCKPFHSFHSQTHPLCSDSGGQPRQTLVRLFLVDHDHHWNHGIRHRISDSHAGKGHKSSDP